MTPIWNGTGLRKPHALTNLRFTHWVLCPTHHRSVLGTLTTAAAANPAFEIHSQNGDNAEDGQIWANWNSPGRWTTTEQNALKWILAYSRDSGTLDQNIFTQFLGCGGLFSEGNFQFAAKCTKYLGIGKNVHAPGIYHKVMLYFAVPLHGESFGVLLSDDLQERSLNMRVAQSVSGWQCHLSSCQTLVWTAKKPISSSALLIWNSINCVMGWWTLDKQWLGQRQAAWVPKVVNIKKLCTQLSCTPHANVHFDHLSLLYRSQRVKTDNSWKEGPKFGGDNYAIIPIFYLLLLRKGVEILAAIPRR